MKTRHLPFLALLMALTIGALGTSAAWAAGGGPEIHRSSDIPGDAPAYVLARPVATLAPLPAPQATPPPAPQPTPTPGGNVVTTIIEQIVRHRLIFPVKSVQEALEGALWGMLNSSMKGMPESFNTILQATLFEAPGILSPGGTIAGPGGAGKIIVQPGMYETTWRQILIVSVLLWAPLLVLMMANAMAGISVAQGWEGDLTDTLLRFGTAVLVSAGSIYLIDFVARLMNAMAKAIMEAGVPISGANVVTALCNSLFLITVFSGAILTPPVGWPVLALLAIAGFMLMMLLGMQLMAKVALLYVLVAIAPLCILSYSLKITEWMTWLWLKGLTLVLLLPVIYALLFKLVVVAVTSGFATGQPVVQMVWNFIVAAGVLSLIITITYKIVEAVWGGLGAFSSQVMGTVTAIGTAAGAVVAGAAAGGVAAGAAGAAGGAAAGGSGGAAGGGAGGAGGLGGFLSSSTGRGLTAALRTTGAGLARSGIPGLRSLGGAMWGAGDAAHGATQTIDGAERQANTQAWRAETRDRGAAQNAGRQAAPGQRAPGQQAEQASLRDQRDFYQPMSRDLSSSASEGRDIQTAFGVLEERHGAQVRPYVQEASQGLQMARQHGYSMSRLAETEGYGNSPGSYVGAMVERHMQARGVPVNNPAFLPPNAGPDEAGAQFNVMPGPNNRPTPYDFRMGAGIAGNLDDTGHAMQYAWLVKETRSLPGGANGQAAVGDLVTMSREVGTAAPADGAGPVQLFVRRLDDVWAQHNLAPDMLPPVWQRYAAGFTG